MKKLMPWLIVTSAILASTLPIAVLGEEATKETSEKPAEPAGMVLFVANGCSECHTVLAAGIGVPEEEAKAEEAEAAAEEPEEEIVPPDLSSVGLEHKAEWFRAYLDKKEKLHDQKHMLRFRGTEEQWTDLVGWLTTLRAGADTTAAGAAEEAAAKEKPEAKPDAAAGESSN